MSANQENHKVKLENQIRQNLGLGWIGELDPFANFVSDALTKHLYDVMSEKNSYKPSFNEWEDLLINKDNLITMLHRLSEYQDNESFCLPEIFKTA